MYRSKDGNCWAHKDLNLSLAPQSATKHSIKGSLFENEIKNATYFSEPLYIYIICARSKSAFSFSDAP